MAHAHATETGSRESVSYIGCHHSVYSIGLGWYKDDDRIYILTVSEVSPAPEAVADLVKWSCAVSKCRVRYSCKAHIMTCKELCKCEAAE